MEAQALPEALTGRLDHIATVAKRKTGRKPSPQTIWRWVKKGLRGGKIQLDAVFHNGYWQTTEAAFDAFLVAQTNAAMDHQPRNGAEDEALKDAGLL